MAFKADSGRSIVEILGVLAIMGVITVIGLAGYSTAMEKSRRDAMDVQIFDIAGRISEMFSGKTFEPTDFHSYFQDELKNLGFNMTDPFGNEIKARYPVLGLDQSNQFTLLLKLDRPKCEYILSKYAGMVEKGDACATQYPVSQILICDSLGCVAEDNLVTLRYRLM
jgi:type II secretory pathway pseudopilin PulG